jgi:hypothetical protein
MKTHFLYLAIGVLLICNCAPAQWIQTSFPDSLPANCFVVGGTNLFAGTGYGGAGGVFLSTNDGTSWTAVNAGLPREPSDSTQYVAINCLGTSGTNLLAGTGWGNYRSWFRPGIFRSTDNGTSWTTANEGLPYHYYLDSGGYPTIFSFGRSGTNLFAGTWWDGIFRSTNGGTSWTAVNTGLPFVTSETDTTRAYRAVTCFGTSGTNLFAGTGSYVISGRGVFLSTNDGTSWTSVNTGLTDSNVTALAVSGTNLFAGTLDGGVFLSTNNGTSWTAVFSSLTGASVRCLAVSGTNLFAGIWPVGVLLLTNNGTSWTAVNAGLPLNDVYALAVCGTNLFAGTPGVWRRPLSELITSVDPVASEMPQEFSLNQNYPNPFNPSTTIQYALPHRSHMTLTVFNTLGQQVATLVNGEVEAGYHEVKIDAAGLSSGVYFYRMQAGDFVQSKKFVLLK